MEKKDITQQIFHPFGLFHSKKSHGKENGKSEPVSKKDQTTGKSPEPQKSDSAPTVQQKPPATREQTRQTVAEAGLEQLPEEQFPDVLLDVPTVKVDEIKIEVDDLQAQVAISADLANLLKLNIGAFVSIKRVLIDILGVEAQAILKVRLKRVHAILARTLDTLDRNPDILNNLLQPVGKAVGEIGSGLGKTVEELGPGLGKATGELGKGLGTATGEIGKGAGKTLGDLGPGLGKATGELGKGLGTATGEIGKGAGKTLGDLGPGLGKATGELGKGLGTATGEIGKGTGKTLGELGPGLGKTTEELGKGLGTATGEIGKGSGKTLGELGPGLEKTTGEQEPALSNTTKKLGEGLGNGKISGSKRKSLGDLEKGLEI